MARRMTLRTQWTWRCEDWKMGMVKKKLDKWGSKIVSFYEKYEDF
jgi:hypothetical protein